MKHEDASTTGSIEIELEIEGTMAASNVVSRLSQLAAVTEVSIVDDAE